MECVPRLREVVCHVATPEASVAVPSVVPPSLNVTEPVAVAGVTVAVKVTADVGCEGFGADVRMVVVAICLTV